MLPVIGNLTLFGLTVGLFVATIMLRKHPH
jgi:hypothetical protein